MKILPFYTSTAQRDAERVSSRDALLCPQQSFLPWQIERDHVASQWVDSIVLVDCDGNETDVYAPTTGGYLSSSFSVLTGWTNDSYNTFVSSGDSILTAIETDTATGFCYSSHEFPVPTGGGIEIDYGYTANSGQIPKFYLGKSDGTLYSTGVSMATGTHNMAYLTADANNSGNVRLLVRNTTNASFACNITAVRENCFQVNEFTSKDYITYKGTPINYQSFPISYGTYYFKVSDGVTDWFSEWFSVRNLSPNIITGWASNTYDVFSGTGLLIGIATENDAVTSWCKSTTFATVTGERLVFTHDFQRVSGTSAINAGIRNLSGVSISTDVTVKFGLRTIEFTTSQTDSAAYLILYTTSACSWKMASVCLRRKAGDYMFLEYTNTKDIKSGVEAILYQYDFTQQIYLDAILNNPQHEMTETGEEKDGVFQPEKLVDKLIYNIVAYVSRSTLKALRLLPMHDDIEITDEVGNLYTPSVGNVRVTWDGGFDTYTLRIDFNEEGDVWTSNMDNIT